MIKPVALILASILLSACSSAQNTNGKKEPIYENYINQHPFESLNKITSFRFHGWRSLDNRYLIISTSLSRSYLIKLASHCSGLRFANTILINNDGNSLHTKFDSIQVANLDVKHGIKEKCLIKSIYQITREQADEISRLGKSKD